MSEHTWRQAYNAGHYQDAAELLLHLDLDSDVEGLLALGSMYLYGMYRFDSEAEYMKFMATSTPEQQCRFWAEIGEVRSQGVRLLEKASERGSWVASQNLVTYYSCNVEGMTDRERAARAKYYAALLDQQREPRSI